MLTDPVHEDFDRSLEELFRVALLPTSKLFREIGRVDVSSDAGDNDRPCRTTLSELVRELVVLDPA